MNSAVAVEPFPRVPPTPPDRAESTFEVQHGFRMELIAAEPLVASPVDLAYDEDGRAYVVEMRDYPFPEEKNAAPTEFPGTVRLIEDTDGDGRFDRHTIFADQLAWPTSVCCYKGGVFVAAAPDIWYFKDTDGDRKADVRRKVFTGFSRYNVQAIMNSLRWGLDNKIYGSASGNGGTVQHAERPDDPPIQLTRRDFRFDPITEKIEAIAGGERYGATFDDWGNRFLCNIRNPVQHVVLPLHYVQRNPHLVVPSLINDCAESGDQLRVYRISPPEPWREFRAQRWSLEGANMPRSELIGAGFWTSSSGVCIYRGAAYPEEFRGNVFVGEVAGNLVHRQVLTRDGVTFKSRRADENAEFVRSRDNWFRPVNFVNAPDGTLTVLDMYRETIEHPWSIPDDIKAQLDLASGKDRGRLYRLAPPGFASSKPPKLSAATSAELVSHLENKNSWYRETAQRLLYERQDKSAPELLRALIRKTYNERRHDFRLGEVDNPQARLHAYHLLNGLNALKESDLFKGAGLDPHPEVCRNMVELAENFLPGSDDLRHALYSNTSGPPFVTLQVAFSADKLARNWALPTLKNIAQDKCGDPWIKAAVISSSAGMGSDLAIQVAGPGGSGSLIDTNLFLRDLAVTVGAQGNPEQIEKLLAELPRGSVIAGLGQGLARRRENLADYVKALPERTRRSVNAGIEGSAVKVTKGPPMHHWARMEAFLLLPFAPWEQARPALNACLASSQPRDVQQAALRVFATFNQSDVATDLIGQWKQLTPPLREESLNALLSRPIWHETLITALESGDIPISQVSIPQRTRLAALRDEKLAERAKKVLASVALGPRKETIDRYQESLTLKGDAARGQIVYRRECANCHKLRGDGHEVGPSLETVQHRSPQEILIHILDPNREVSPHFLDYTVRLNDGRVLTGLIAAETDSGLTLHRAQNQKDYILREDIDDITSSGKSLMPEGVEQKITLQEMSDLIAYLRQGT